MTALNKWDNLLRRFPALKMYAANPVVMRDLRAQMRGPRAYWYIGGYLLLLGVLAVAGYAQAVGQSLNPANWESGTRNIVDAQANLEGFYIFIFGTLALLVTLIAPALTAASVVGERQRQSFDLVVTTPLTSGQLLVGKLLSSIAFLGLLLALSLPASALCVLLGGATIGDVFRIYFQLAVDGIVLASIGLYFSCAVRVPLLATVWTYLAVVGFNLVTGVSVSTTLNGPSPMPLRPILSLLWLNPFASIMPVMSGEGTHLTLLLRLAVFLGIATLLVRVLLAAATYRLGLFGAHSGVSIRRQSLVLAGVLSGFLSYAISEAAAVRAAAQDGSTWIANYQSLIIGVLMVALPFLPGLFVPASAEDAPPGTTSETAPDAARDRLFAVRRLFRPEHSGSLPWYAAFVLTVIVAILAGAAPFPALWSNVVPLALTGGFYLLALGVLFWSLSRLAASLVAELSPARATAFALMIGVLGLPTLLLAFQHGDWQASPLAPLWLLSPLLYPRDLGRMMDAMLRSGMMAVAIGTVVFLVARNLREREAHNTGIAAAR